MSVAEAAGPPDTTRQPILLYDDGCRFCRAMTRLIAAWDRPRRVAILPWSHPWAAGWLAALPGPVLHRSMHLRTPDGALVSGGDSFVALLGYLPGAGWLARLARKVPRAGAVIGGAYLIVAGRRGFLSRLVPNCAPVLREPAA